METTFPKKGLSLDKVFVACAVNKSGTALSKAAKTGKVSTACLDEVFSDRILSGSIFCIDHDGLGFIPLNELLTNEKA